MMQADPKVGIELPLGVRSWSDAREVHLWDHVGRELAQSYDVGAYGAGLAMAAVLPISWETRPGGQI